MSTTGRDLVAAEVGWGAHGRKLRSHFDLAGDSLRRSPRGVDADHPAAHLMAFSCSALDVDL